jgi:UDP-glucose 4-epimerase
VIAIFIKRILKGKKPILFGKGNQTRDFLYVEDAVEAAILAQRALSGSIYNVGTGKETSLKELLKLISEILNKKIKVIYKPKIKGEITRSFVSYSKIKRELGWEPKFSLKEGLKKNNRVF